MVKTTKERARAAHRQRWEKQREEGIRDRELVLELYLRGPFGKLPTLRRALLDRVAPPWRHAAESERETRDRIEGKPDVILFHRQQSDQIPAADLMLAAVSEQGYRVCTIVPPEMGLPGFTSAEWNSVLLDFVKSIAEPAAKESGFHTDVRTQRVERAEVPATDEIRPESAH